MKKNRAVFVDETEEKLSLGKQMMRQFGWLLKAIFPFIENMVCFIPFFMLNNRTVGSQYFSRLDFLSVLCALICYRARTASGTFFCCSCGMRIFVPTDVYKKRF